MELLLHRLPRLAPVLVTLHRSSLHPLKVFLRLLQPLDKHLLFGRQVGWVLLQQLRHLLCPRRLYRLLLPQLRVQIVLSCAVHEPLHMLFHERPIDDVDDARPRLLVLGEEHLDDLFELVAVVPIDRLLLVLHNLEDKAEEVLRVEGVLQIAELVENAAKSPNVRLVRIRLVLADLGRHVVGRALNCHRMVLRALQYFRYAKVSELHRVVFRQENVRGLQVAVKNLPTVNVLQ